MTCRSLEWKDFRVKATRGSLLPRVTNLREIAVPGPWRPNAFTIPACLWLWFMRVTVSGDLGKFNVRTWGSDRLLVQSDSNQNAIINCLLPVVRRDEILEDGKELIVPCGKGVLGTSQKNENQPDLLIQQLVWLNGCYVERWWHFSLLFLIKPFVCFWVFKHFICKRLFSLLLHVGMSGLVPETYSCCYWMLSVLLPSGQESGQHSRVQANLIWKMRCQHLCCCCAHPQQKKKPKNSLILELWKWKEPLASTHHPSSVYIFLYQPSVETHECIHM